ncbi:hypothetical protein [Maridesulfovibrio hydrothermalis]|uniref:Uncharacterized protein n=1 Tax=Maridesulfovibrio hydrothermalis AM13 = DSM 14728 TaxID=1121451 RepID=L0REQ5_9BACT|nr:hypothetical protein [Maridesulfovibrio hydrothermalis]CCO24692.1 conserved exported protein of unknown function [Maridesulfovibrio hydrothermalis AM13 = DSM 14728]
MKKILLLLTLAAIFVFTSISTVLAQDTPFKSYSFTKKKASAQWSARKTYVIGKNRRLGLFNNRNKRYPSQTVLSISNLPDGKSVDVKLDVIFVGSWDNEGKLADRFTVTVLNGPIVLDMRKFPCTLIDSDDTKPLNNNGFVQVGERDRAYWIKPLSFEISPDLIKNNELKLEFKGYLTGRKTEFWAIDNVQIFVN